MRLLFVHGRAQQGRVAKEIKVEWENALNAGLSKAKLQPTEIVPEVPFYGDILDVLTRRASGLESPDKLTRGPERADYEKFLGEFAAEAAQKTNITPDELERHGFPSHGRPFKSEDDNLRHPDFEDRGPYNWPWVLAIVRAIDSRWSGVSAGGISVILRDVYVYITEAAVRAEIDGIVQNSMRAEPTAIVGHSLGSVVAYNVLANNPPCTLVKYVTVGSPLGIAAVRERLPIKPHMPSSVKVWYNAFDPKDIVALNPLNAAHFPTRPEITNKGDIQNLSDNHHHISHYLDDPDVAKQVHLALKS